MASPKAIAAALGMLGRAFAGTVDAARADVYHAALEDVSDEALMAGVVALIKTHTGEFIPPPAVIRKAAGANRNVVVDAATIIRQIEKLAIYNPNVGMVYPSASTVREQLGEAVAYAYVAGGATRLFADNETTREIATRDFENAVKDMAKANGRGGFPVLGGDSSRLIAPPAPDD